MAKRGNVLVVEDDACAREALRSALGAEYEVFTAATALDAVEALRRNPIHTVTLEPWLPGVQGRELLECLKRARPEARVIIVSGHRLSLWFDDLVREQVFDYLPKPFEVRDLMRSIDRSVLRQRVRSVLAETTLARPERPGAGRAWVPLAAAGGSRVVLP